MPDFILEIRNGQAIVNVVGSDLLAVQVTAAENARDAVRPLYGNGPPAAALGIDGSFYRDVTNPLQPNEWFKVGAAWTGPQSLKGLPGGNVSDVGNLAAAKATNLAVTQPGTTTIRLSDRGKAVFEKDTGALGDLLTKYPAAENLWWFRDAGATRWLLAGEQVSIQHVGAVQGKAAENTAVIQAALDFGKLTGRSIHVPAGTWGYTGTITIGSNTGLHGIPGMSILWCPVRTNTKANSGASVDANGTGAIIMEGDRCSLYGITRIHYMPRPVSIRDRTGSDTGDGIYVKGATNFLVSHCRTEGPQAASIMLRGCQYGRVTNNVFDSSLADCIHVTAAQKGDISLFKADGTFDKVNPIPIPSRWIHIADNVAMNCGDDHIAIVSYVFPHEYTEPSSNPLITIPGYWTDPVIVGANRVYQAINQSIEVVGNSVYGGDARGISVVGGKNVNISGNYIEDPVQAGVLVQGDEFYKTYGNENVNVTGNTIVAAGNSGNYKPLRYDAYGAGMTDRNGAAGLTRNLDGASNPSILIGGRSAVYPNNTISFRDNMLIGSRQRAIAIQANSTTIAVSDNTIRDTISDVIYVSGGSNVAVDFNQIINAGNSAVYVNIAAMSGYVSVFGNRLDTVVTSATQGMDAIHFDGAPGAGVTSSVISYNSITGPVTYERFIEAFYDSVVAEGNVGQGNVSLGAQYGNIKQRIRAAALPTTASAADIVTALKNAGLMSP